MKKPNGSHFCSYHCFSKLIIMQQVRTFPTNRQKLTGNYNRQTDGAKTRRIFSFPTSCCTHIFGVSYVHCIAQTVWSLQNKQRQSLKCVQDTRQFRSIWNTGCNIPTDHRVTLPAYSRGARWHVVCLTFLCPATQREALSLSATEWPVCFALRQSYTELMRPDRQVPCLTYNQTLCTASSHLIWASFRKTWNT